MSWLSVAWRKIKGGRSDAETAFSIITGGMDLPGRNHLILQLQKVQFAVDVASTVNTDKRIAEAKVWVDRALDMLGD